MLGLYLCYMRAVRYYNLDSVCDSRRLDNRRCGYSRILYFYDYRKGLRSFKIKKVLIQKHAVNRVFSIFTDNLS